MHNKQSNKHKYPKIFFILGLSPIIGLGISHHPQVKTRGYSENLFQNIFLVTTNILISYKYIIKLFRRSFKI
jgi:hypothetical protein